MQPTERLKIFYWPAHSQDGCFLYRIDMPMRGLLARGHDVRVAHAMGDWAHHEADIVVGQRVATTKPSTGWQILAKTDVERGRRRLVYELDDDLFNISRQHNPYAPIFEAPGVQANMRRNVEVSSLVTVSTEPLAEVVRQWSDNVVVLPNAVRDEVFDVPLNPARGLPDRVCVIGWQGSDTHREDWDMINDWVREVLYAEPRSHLRFLGTAYGRNLPVMKISARPWTTDLMLHYRRMAFFDIGLAPLTGRVFNNAKSGLKAMEGMALGIPMVCSDVPAYRAVVEHGKTGFLVRGRKQWVDTLRELVADHELRVRVGDAAREAARAWTIGERAPLWESAYASLRRNDG